MEECFTVCFYKTNVFICVLIGDRREGIISKQSKLDKQQVSYLKP